MEYSKLANLYMDLGKTTKRLEKTEILSNFLKKISKDEIKPIIYLLRGKVFPQNDQRKIGISNRLIIKVLSTSSGTSKDKVENLWKEKGDLGKVAESLIKKKKQSTLFKKKLTVEKVFENIRKLPEFEGKGTVNKKLNLVAELLSSSSSLEARFIVSTILEQLRVGVASGLIRDSTAKAFNVDVKSVEKAYNLITDHGEVALIAKTKGNKGLQSLTLSPGQPVKAMLALLSNDIEEAFKAVGTPAQLEFKIDGFRLQIHKKNNEIKLFTRRLEDVTRQFPDVVKIVKNHIKSKNYILDCEVVGYDKKTNKNLPFQNISQRIKRKHQIEAMVKNLPIEINAFDILYYKNQNLMNLPLKKRRDILEKSIKQEKRKIVLTKKLITSDAKKADEFFKKSLSLGYEGLMVKNLNGNYIAGRYVNGWMKLKSILEPLDLVIVKAEHGEGKRSKWITSYTVACKDKNNLLEVGKVSTGLKEKTEGLTYEKLTKLIKPLIKEEEGKKVIVKPKLIIEVCYEEIQKSVNYSSGYALRFPKVKSLRTDKPLNEISTLKLVKKIYDSQRGKK